MKIIIALLIPLLFLSSFLYAAVKKVPVYDAFTKGASKAIPLVCSLFPFLAAVTILTRLLTASGVEEYLLKLLSPAFRFFGIPEEIAGLVLIKPISGGGSMAVLAEKALAE